ncbi:MAG: tetratricopeptide repeat protein [Verrucomicrobiae bacterium]|nr:tetratricopeptide repeat protein [Verrucomicrobiae bacterium]
MEQKEKSPFGFAQRQLPWIVGACALILYAVTVNHWTRLETLPTFVKFTGIDNTPVISAPLLFVLTYPVRWLPAASQTMVFNLLSALLAAVTLMLLARSVSLLPYDRTNDTRWLERNEHALLTQPPAWLPAVFAVLLCGLQLTFWEHATGGPGEMLDLLLFAYLIRCLLEYRIDRNERWLYKLAFVSGLAVTNNYAMIPFLPCFVVALVWIMGFEFFRWKFIARMVGLGICGLLLYLLLPLVNMVNFPENGGFIAQLRTVMGLQKGMLIAARQYTYILIFLSFTSFLPLVMIGVRWARSPGDLAPAGAVTSTLALRVVYAFLFVACVSVFFDPKWSPRILGAGYVLLPFYYLSALCAGYFTGYFLLVLSSGGSRPFPRHQPQAKTLRPVGIGLAVACGTCVLVLAQRNFPVVTLGNGTALAQFADLLVGRLTNDQAYIIADSPLELMVAQCRLHQTGSLRKHVVLNSALLQFGSYHRLLSKVHGQRWLLHPGPEETESMLQPSAVNALLTALARTNNLYYLHPSFGYFFEVLQARSKGMLYAMKALPNDPLLPPPLSGEELAENRKFWEEAEPLIRKTTVAAKNVPPERQWVAQSYSRALNAWGVTLQRHGFTKEAERWFKLAVELFPDNAAAATNLAFNAQLQSGGRLEGFDVVRAAEQTPQDDRVLERMLLHFGPFDEPAWLYRIANAFMQAGLFRQSLVTFDRLHTLMPTDSKVDVWKSTMEVMTRFAMGDAERAEKDAVALHTKYPKEDLVLEVMAQMYMQTGRYTNALEAIEKQLILDSSNRRALLNKAAVSIHLKQYTNAIATLDKLLSLDPNSAPALLNRAIAYLQIGNLDRAKQDYEAVYKVAPDSFQVLYGLAEVAYRRNDTSTALKFYQQYLKHAPKDTDEYKQIAQRVSELQGHK